MTITFSRGAPPRSTTTFEAAHLPRSQKEELCRSLLSEFGATSVRAKGDELIHGCLVDPSHTRQDREPTASLNVEKLVYKCLGCGSSGGLLWFIAQCRGVDITSARRWLDHEAGLGGNAMELDRLRQFLDSLYASGESRAPIPVYATRMLDPWAAIHPYLTDPRDAGGRGIPEESVLALRFGYAPSYAVGDRVSERIVLPHFWRGDLVGWQSRRLGNDGTPKYLSSPDFPKDVTLYHYERSHDRAVVVEAVLSVAAHVHALPQLEATFGASVTTTQMQLLAQHESVVLFFDNDAAGWAATDQVATTLSRSCPVFVVDNPYAADPADMSTDDVLALTTAAIPYSIWRRPERLLCYRCKETAHDHRC